MAAEMELLTVEDVAERLHLHIDSVRRMMREGRLPAVKLGRKWWIRKDVFEALFLKSEDKQTN